MTITIDSQRTRNSNNNHMVMYGCVRFSLFVDLIPLQYRTIETSTQMTEQNHFSYHGDNTTTDNY